MEPHQDSNEEVLRRRAQAPAGPLRLVLWAASFYFIVAYLGVALRRIRFPYELEWLEGSIADHIARVLDGQPLFVEPSVEFIPHLYTPLYYYVSALVAGIVGPGLLPGRLVSLLASLGCLFVIFRFVERETRSRTPALFSAGLFAATYHATGSWLDLVRVDSLALLLSLVGLYGLRAAHSARSSLVAALFFALAFFAKQSALVVALPLCAYCVIALRGRSRWTFPLALLSLVTLGTAIAQWSSDGWFGYYVFDLPRQHQLFDLPGQHAYFRRMLVEFWTIDLLWHLPVACAIAGVFVARVSARPDKRALCFYGAWGLGAVAAGWSFRLHLGGDPNVLLPTYAMIAICCGLGLHELVAPGPPAREAGAGSDGANGFPRRPWLATTLYGVCTVQLLLLLYDPRAEVPAPADRAAGDRLVAILSSVEGEVFLPAHGYVPRLAGRTPLAHSVAIADVMRGVDGEVKARFTEGMREVLQRQRFAAILTLPPGFEREVEARYRRAGRIWRDAGFDFPRGGAHTKRGWIYVPRTGPTD